MPIGKRREFEVFTLSFLDCICCGFGAIILLLVLTDVGQPIVIERSEKDLKQQIDALQRQLFELRGETEVLNRELQGRMSVLNEEQRRIALMAGDLTKIRGEFKASKGEATVTNIVETELVAAHQTLTAEMARLLQDNAVDMALERPLDMPDWISTALLFRAPFVIIASGSNEMLADVAEGSVMPLELFPGYLGQLVGYLPFRHSLAFPVENLLGLISREQMLRDLALQWAWVLVFMLLASLLWRAGMRRFGAFGG